MLKLLNTQDMLTQICLTILMEKKIIFLFEEEFGYVNIRCSIILICNFVSEFVFTLTGIEQKLFVLGRVPSINNS